MPKSTNRDKLLTQGLRVVHQQGLAGASVRDIVQAAGVPQGSFTNHFPSKEAFGVEILDLYFGFTRKVLWKPTSTPTRRSSTNGAWKMGACTAPTPPR